METIKFRTKAEIIPKDMQLPGNKWLIAVDLGYSAIKLIAPNKVACTPSYARKVNDNFEFVRETPDEAVLYKDLDTGETWLVGKLAQNMIKKGDTADSELSLYGRQRYSSDMFKVLVNASLGIGLSSNNIRTYHGEEIYIQTGLPEKYLEDDRDYLVEDIQGRHNFALKIGKKNWNTYTFDVKESNINVMSQPRGTLFSVCIDKNGDFVDKAEDYMTSDVIVFDSGFGTLDIFTIDGKVQAIGPGETYDDLGMKRVFQETSKLIKEKYHVSVPVPAMQNVLEEGTVRFVDKKERRTTDYDISQQLATACFNVCTEAIRRMDSVFGLENYKYLILTGGTGSVWANKIKGYFQNYPTLEIVMGNQNDELDMIYSNVRGYYMYRYNMLLG